MKNSNVYKVVLSAAVMLALPAATRAGVAGTPHDLSKQAGWNISETCLPCHIPHNGKAVTGAPLWNHGSSVATYALYSSSTLNATVGQPTGTSKLCMSCHDGTVAIDTFGNTTGTHLMTGTSSSLMGTDLSNDHPVSFTYDGTLASADKGLVTPTSASWVDAGSTLPLFSGKLECGTCHNAHDDSKGNFLRISNAGSALCLKCHVK